MLSLIWTIFFLHVAIYVVNTAGASTIDSLVRPNVSWSSYTQSHGPNHFNCHLDQLFLDWLGFSPLAMAPLPEITHINFEECAGTEPVEARSPRAETRHEQHQLSGWIRKVG